MARSNSSTGQVFATTTPGEAELADNATVSNVPASATTITLFAANPARLGASVFNDSTAALFIKLGSGASTTSYTFKAGANAYYEVPFNYLGLITGAWESATGTGRITEVTS